jgi:hypothetical protein
VHIQEIFSAHTRSLGNIQCTSGSEYSSLHNQGIFSARSENIQCTFSDTNRTILLFRQKHVYYYYYSGEHSGYIQGTFSAYSGKIQCTFRKYSAHAFSKENSVHIQETHVQQRTFSALRNIQRCTFREYPVRIHGTFSAHFVWQHSVHFQGTCQLCCTCCK